MGIKSLLSKPFAKLIAFKTKQWQKKPVEIQQKWMLSNVLKAANTAFGIDHDFKNIHSYQDFKRLVPIRDYEDLVPYVNRMVKGEENVLWPGKPLYLAKTSGTTSGVKYIPISKESISNHIDSARNAILAYINETGKAEFVDKKLIFLSGIFVGRLSGISNHHIPAYLRKNQLPSYETNCIEDWETKLDKIIDETLGQDMSLISGIPPWVQMYFDKIEAKTGKKIKDVFPDFNLFIYGGVNFEPYKAKLFESIGKKIDSIELYPASEGFIAYQDSQTAEGMLLILNSGLFFEFIPADEFFDEKPTRLHIGEVEIGKNYALIINSNAGLWGYSIGDTIKFVSLSPHRIIVSGRIKHFISAFGEHVIGEEVEKAMKYACEKHPEVELVEFTVAPMVSPSEGLPYHEWLVEFAKKPKNMEAFEADLDQKMIKLNVYYEDLIIGNILKPLKVSNLESNAFINYMKSIGKLGGQNKVPRLSNDRKIADVLVKI
jgi:GH3 auxin-responsive promoter